ncbi:hypothetical protein GPJ56_007727 [Histomonas meleagridis]|uniref:uncharacterized protein n=1 Tax=Histomonas meleagridis TaxID=135588 RepID=UPI00355A0E70|nr:hypothetical protein GPJ56_007727 [Histomonas meleagridis]KAH0801553.1 hypothetical protein GO595_005689 [Histomonas meleagridis]
MLFSGANQSCSFYVFIHKPAKKGAKGEEEGNLLDSVKYRYPPNISDETTENFLSSVVSLYTFMTVTFEGDGVNVIAYKQTNAAIRTIPFNGENLLFFVLRMPASYTGAAVLRALDRIVDISLFSLGPGIQCSEQLENYLKDKGKKLCDQIFCLTPINFTFPQILSGNWNRSIVMTAITEFTIINSNPNIWGISCHVQNKLFISHISPEFASFFVFAPFVKNRAIVYMNPKQKSAICNFPKCNSNIPNDEIIKTLLLKFEGPDVTFYVLTSPDLTKEEKKKIKEALRPSFENMNQQFQQYPEPSLEANTAIYDNALCYLRSNEKYMSSSMESNIIFAHDIFESGQNVNEIIMQNSNDLTFCLKTQTTEFYSSVPFSEKEKGEFASMFDAAISPKRNKELNKLMATLMPYQQF